MSSSRPTAPVPRAQDQTHSFGTVPVALIPRSQFDLSSRWLGTFDAGLLIPVKTIEVLPGDTFNVGTTALLRLLSPLKYPMFDDLYVDFHWWFVPNRLVWTNWVRMMGEQDNPTDTIAYTVPKMTLGDADVPNGSLYDMMGLPTAPLTTAPKQYVVDTLRFRAYNLIWNAWYRDENQQDSVLVRIGDTGDVPGDFTLLRRGKRMTDYLVSALPFPQKGAAVTLPLGTSAPITGTGQLANQIVSIFNTNGGAFEDLKIGATTGVNVPANLQAATGTNTTGDIMTLVVPGGVNPGTFAVDLSSATAATINTLRTAVVFQQLLEQFARGGTRYVELIRSLFGVISPDARLQRPEFLGASNTVINVYTVPQTSATAGTPQASLAAYGLGTMHGQDFVHSFTEHGQIICLCSVRAPYTYQQRIDRSWTRQTRFDYYMPPMAMLGEQAILMQEVFVTGLSSHDTVQVFGYSERWAEYRVDFSLIVGQFRSNFAQTLDFRHLAQVLDGSTVLNEDFIIENPPVDRVSAVSGAPDFECSLKFNIRAVRPLPTHSVPGLTRL